MVWRARRSENSRKNVGKIKMAKFAKFRKYRRLPADVITFQIPAFKNDAEGQEVCEYLREHIGDGFQVNVAWNDTRGVFVMRVDGPAQAPIYLFSGDQLAFDGERALRYPGHILFMTTHEKM